MDMLGHKHQHRLLCESPFHQRDNSMVFHSGAERDSVLGMVQVALGMAMVLEVVMGLGTAKELELAMGTGLGWVLAQGGFHKHLKHLHHKRFP